LATEDRLAFGLTASHLSYLVVGSLAGYAILASGLPGLVKYPLGIVFISLGVVLAWGRLGQRPLDTWAWLAARYYLRPRRSPLPAPGAAVLLLAADSDDPPEPNMAPVTFTIEPEPGPSTAADEPWEPNTAPVTLGIDPEAKPKTPPRPEPAPPDATEPDSSPGSVSSTKEDHEPRILSLPAHFSRVADGATEYRIASDPEPEPEAASAPQGTPVFLAQTQRVAFFSLKGGVGKTTLATEVAAHLARRGRYRARPEAAAEPLRVALLDLDLGSANVSMKLGLTHPTLWDLVLDPEPDADRIEECLVLHEDSGLRVLLGPPRAIAAGETRALAMQRLAQVLNHLDEDGYHFVFLDLSSDIDELTTYALEAAHQVYYVITPTASGVQDTYRGVETLRRLGHRRKLRFVLNQQRAGFNPDEMLADLGGTLSASIPRDDAFSSAEDDHEPLSLQGSGAGAQAIGALAASIYPNLESGPPRRGFWARLRRRLG
jgi:MinD-like ATPase involved in chromosome partitioning or flagellar assembly